MTRKKNTPASNTSQDTKPDAETAATSMQSAMPPTPDAPPRTRTARLRLLKNLIHGRPHNQQVAIVQDALREWGMSKTAVADYKWSLGL